MAKKIVSIAAHEDWLSLWTTDKLRQFMRDKSLPVSGTKVELVAKVKEIIETEALEEELEAGVFTHYIAPPGVNFKDLPENNWSAERIPKVKESDVCDYLKKHGGYTKNYRTMTMKKETMTISIKSLVNLPFTRLFSVTSSHGLL
jgi:alpha-L-fucosidase